ncbi:hypothetical protein [Bradyrhizobium japonicum]|uniref:hypothetical protein n=1 Tax=Bradyrhizobium japonicum TaxID=375 RepID=UPI0012FD90CE|nr:hypothetical protein [Bradyrhizobium japonicum]
MSNSSDEPGPERVDLSPDPISGSLRSDPRRTFDQPSVARFAGLIGDDDDGAKVRIYLDYELNTYILIDRKDILHRERLKNMSGVDVSVVFVRADAVVHAREISSQSVQADALSQALRAAESGAYPGANSAVATTIPCATPAVTALICTKVLCTNFTCACTSRHSLLCSIICTEHVACPNPWTKNWFCAA